MDKAMVGVFIGIWISVIGYMIIDRVLDKAEFRVAMKCSKYGKFEWNHSVYECKELGR